MLACFTATKTELQLDRIVFQQQSMRIKHTERVTRFNFHKFSNHFGKPTVCLHMAIIPYYHTLFPSQPLPSNLFQPQPNLQLTLRTPHFILDPKMQRSFPLSRQAHRLLQMRQASNWATARYSNIVRSESNIDTIHDPPTAPLPEEHEAGHGPSDFSNWVERHRDVSDVQAFSGLGVMLLTCYGLWRLSQAQVAATAPLYTAREFPTVERDFPNWAGAKDVRKE